VSTTLGEELATGRTLRCRYLRRNGERCANPTAGVPDGADPVDQDVVLLCPRHLYRAWQQFSQSVPAETVARWKRVFKEGRS
jgi:hypothetical protein